MTTSRLLRWLAVRLITVTLAMVAIWMGSRLALVLVLSGLWLGLEALNLTAPSMSARQIEKSLHGERRLP
jgi:Mn2+/Fe2+ NRAMP family transporter